MPPIQTVRSAAREGDRTPSYSFVRGETTDIPEDVTDWVLRILLVFVLVGTSAIILKLLAVVFQAQ